VFRVGPFSVLMQRITFVALTAALTLLCACSGDPGPSPTPRHPRVGATGPTTTAVASAPVPSPAPSSSAAAPAPAPTAPKKLNVLVISIDAFRADHAPWLGYERPVAPNLTKLAKRSTSYSRAYSLSSYTAMSMGGFLGGRYPGELKRNGSFFSQHPDDELFFPELLQKAGVKTIAAQAHFYFDEKAGFRQGFDVYEMVPGIKVDATTDKSVTSPKHTELAIELLKKHGDEQFFAWFHFMDPHDRYRKHEGFRSFGHGGGKGRYDGEIFFTDHYIGELLDFVRKQPWSDRTAIIVTSDHGEAFGEHKMTRHGFELWEPLIHVPLLIALPGGTGRQIDVPRSHIDLPPTIFDLLGVEMPDMFHGQSLLPEVRGEAKPEPRDVIVDLPRTRHNWRRRAMIRGDHKLLSFGDDFRFELYDVVKDPLEQRDLRGTDKELYKELKKDYLEKVKSIEDICPSKTNGLRGKMKGKRC
jgi:arylsulfatase A-like enzyme